MAHEMTRREFAAVGAAGLIGLVFGRRARGADSKTLRFIVRTDLRVLDPIWTTAYVSRNHGYMIFDTLFALDSKFKPQPQMVGDYTISPDNLVYRFALRPGLKFHDGQSVRGADCVASLRRWMARDALGQALAGAIDEMTGGDDAFTIRLKEPFPLLLEGLAKVSSLAPFIMPERMANTDPYQQITDTVGSGPFKFVRDAFEPGHKAVYLKNPDYVPRSEHRGVKSSRSSGSNGSSFPSLRSPPRRSPTARSIGGRTHPPIWLGSSPPIPTSRSKTPIRSAAWDCCGSTSCSRPSTTSRCARQCWRLPIRRSS
jgi:ABC-type transport system substrate-binding protein